MLAFRVVVFSLGLMMSAACAGCGGGAPTTVKVTGHVTFDGQPLAMGTVTFSPQAADGGALARPAVGKIGADGSYSLSTFAPNDGALPGKYMVSIVSNSKEPSLEEMDAGAKVESAIPKGYNNPRSSGLTAEVPASGAPTINFDLTTGGAPDEAPDQGTGAGAAGVDQFGT